MRALIRECDAELREYDALLVERIETVQESMVLFSIWVGLFGKSDLEVQARYAAKKKPTSMPKEKSPPSTTRFAYRSRSIVCLCAILAPLEPVTDGCLLWCIRAPPPPYCLSVHVPRRLAIPFLYVLNQTVTLPPILMDGFKHAPEPQRTPVITPSTHFASLPPHAKP